MKGALPLCMPFGQTRRRHVANRSIVRKGIFYFSFCMIFGASMNNILFIIKVKILMFIEWPYRSPRLCWVLSLEWLLYFEHVIQSIGNTCLNVSILGATPNHIPLKYRCLIREVIIQPSTFSFTLKALAPQRAQTPWRAFLHTTITYLNRTFIFEWCEVMCGSNNMQQLDMCLIEIEL